MDRLDRLSGTLLGTALGDALGLPAEGLSAGELARRFGRVDRFCLLGRTGFVSDDTELAALVAQSLALRPDDPAACEEAFRRSLAGWLLRLPFGIGMATLKACLRAALGISPSGVASAGNGAAMRAAVIGVFFEADPGRRRSFGEALARTTHTDPRAVQAALFCAELAAEASCRKPGDDRAEMARRALRVVEEPVLRAALELALDLARTASPADAAAARLGNTGYAVHTAGLALFFFLRLGHAPLEAISAAIAAGGDTDTIAAIVGAWAGALHGEKGLPTPLLDAVQDGPFGPSHLRALARALAMGKPPPDYSCLGSLLRNLALLPVILGHGFLRLFNGSGRDTPAKAGRG